MEKKNNSGILVGILIGIIIMLLVVGGLFATGTIGFKTNTANNNGNINTNSSEDNNIDKSSAQSKDIDKSSEIIYYQWYPEEDESTGGSHSVDILELNVDGTAKLHGGKRNSSGWSYEGTYTENDTQIVFTGKATVGNEELLGTDEYVKTFKKQGDSLYDERNFEYSRVTKDELKG